MNIEYRACDGYYEGEQRFSILGDSMFRKSIGLFLAMTCILAPTSLMIKPGMQRETAYIAIFLMFYLPGAIWLTGGMKLKGWLWYVAYAALFGYSTISIAMGSGDANLLLLAPACFCLYMMDRNAPHVLETMGYKGKLDVARELFFTCALGGSMISYIWMAQALVRKQGYMHHSAGEFVWLFATAGLYYGTLWGVLQGINMRRFLELRYELVVPVIVNSACMAIYWLPSAIGFAEKKELMSFAAIMQAIGSQTALGMVYYFNRSTRPLLLAFILFYIFLKSVTL